MLRWIGRALLTFVAAVGVVQGRSPKESYFEAPIATAVSAGCSGSRVCVWRHSS